VFDKQIKSALRLISKNGQLVTWRIVSEVKNTSSPWESDSQVLVNNTVSICFLPVNIKTLESLTLKKDMEIPEGCVLGYMGAVPFTPNLNDVVIRAGVKLSVFYIDKLAPNGQNILYTLLLKE
jgi:hypothetical protein